MIRLNLPFVREVKIYFFSSINLLHMVNSLQKSKIKFQTRSLFTRLYSLSHLSDWLFRLLSLHHSLKSD